MPILRLILLCLVLLPVMANAQKFHLSAYTTGNGLPTNHVRHVAQDRFGFLWLATDAGLVRFDGSRFQSFDKEVPSQSGRFLLKTGGKLLYSHDAGISLIEPAKENPQFRLLVPGAITPDTGNLYYPNRMFQATDGSLWISQPDGRIGRWQNDTLVQYDLGREVTTGASDAQFLFAETDKGRLWAAAPAGQLFVFDEVANKFTPTYKTGPVHSLLLRDQVLWLGGEKLHLLTLNATEDAVLRAQDYEVEEGSITTLAQDSRGNAFLGIRDRGLFLLDGRAGKQEKLKSVFSNNDPHRVDPLPFKNIYNIHVQNDQELWTCSEEGFGILRKRFFEGVSGLPNGNTNSLAAAADGTIFVNFGDVFRVRSSEFGFEATPLPSPKRGTISALTATNGQLWAGTSAGELLQLSTNGQLQAVTDLSWRGEGIFYLLEDQTQRIWICQAPTEQPIIGVACRQPDGQLKIYDQRSGLDNRILVVRQDPKGRIYAAGIGPATYLYRYLPEEDAFLNLSLPMNFPVSPNFEVHDFAIDGAGLIWLATTDGLLQYDLDRIRRVDLGPEFREVEIRAVAAMADGSIWLSSDTEGVLQYRNGEVLAMEEESGLPSKIMAYRALLVDAQQRLWTGSAEGVVYSLRPAPQPLPTARPLFLSVEADGNRLSMESPEIFEEQAATFRFITPAFHGYRVFYQYQLDDQEWIDTDLAEGLILNDLTEGPHPLRVRARKEGGFSWSEPTEVTLLVKKKWYRQEWLNGVWIGLAFLGVIGFYLLKRSKYRKQIISLRAQLKDEER